MYTVRSPTLNLDLEMNSLFQMKLRVYVFTIYGRPLSNLVGIDFVIKVLLIPT